MNLQTQLAENLKRDGANERLLPLCTLSECLPLYLGGYTMEQFTNITGRTLKAVDGLCNPTYRMLSAEQEANTAAQMTTKLLSDVGFKDWANCRTFPRPTVSPFGVRSSSFSYSD